MQYECYRSEPFMYFLFREFKTGHKVFNHYFCLRCCLFVSLFVCLLFVLLILLTNDFTAVSADGRKRDCHGSMLRHTESIVVVIYIFLFVVVVGTPRTIL